MECYRHTMNYLTKHLKTEDRHLAPKGGGRTPNVHKCIIVPTPGILQSCLFQRKTYNDCKSALPTYLEEKMRMTTEIH